MAHAHGCPSSLEVSNLYPLYRRKSTVQTVHTDEPKRLQCTRARGARDSTAGGRARPVLLRWCSSAAGGKGGTTRQRGSLTQGCWHLCPAEMALPVLLIALLLTAAPLAHARAGVADGPERLRRSAEMGELENVKKLILKEKVDVNSAPMFGETPLHWSSQSGHLEVVEELISLGGDVGCETRCALRFPCVAKLHADPPSGCLVRCARAGQQDRQRRIHAVK
eukprot:COSAG03_NODE_2150_length_3074_cov_1.504874_3_plen_222_part_00